MKKAQKALAFIIAAVMLLALSACGHTTPAATETTTGAPAASEPAAVAANEAAGQNANQQETSAGKIILAVDDNTFTVGPFGVDSAVRDWIGFALWGTLAYRPYVGAMLAKDELQYVMAKEIKKVDEKTYDVVIYDNITDSQGNPIKASDVVFSFDMLNELGYSTDISSYYASGSALGDYELEIKLKSADEGAIEAVVCEGTICSQAWYEGATEDQMQSDPATTGPYMVTALEPGASVTLEKRDYWKSPDIDRALVEYQNVNTMEIKCIAEASMRSIALENKEVDLAEVNASDVAHFTGDSKYNIAKYANAMNDYLVFNTSENSPCQDLKVRQAVAYAFDAWTMFLGNGHDQGTLLYDVCPNITTDYVDAWDTESYYEHDVEMAKSLLAEAGYGEGELTIRMMKMDKQPEGPCVAFQAMMLEAGINCEILPFERALFFTNLTDDTVWDVVTYSEMVKDFTTTYWCSLFSDENWAQGTQGFTQDPKLQELLDAACADRSEANMNAFHDYVAENCLMLGLYNETKSVVVQSGIEVVCLVNGNVIPQACVFAGNYQSVG